MTAFTIRDAESVVAAIQVVREQRDGWPQAIKGQLGDTQLTRGANLYLSLVQQGAEWVLPEHVDGKHVNDVLTVLRAIRKRSGIEFPLPASLPTGSGGRRGDTSGIAALVAFVRDAGQQASTDDSTDSEGE